MANTKKFCINCQHHREENKENLMDICINPNLFDPINGEQEKRSCYYERSLDGDCKIEGKNYEKKERS